MNIYMLFILQFHFGKLQHRESVHRINEDHEIQILKRTRIYVDHKQF